MAMTFKEYVFEQLNIKAKIEVTEETIEELRKEIRSSTDSDYIQRLSMRIQKLEDDLRSFLNI